jgi:hypothetical protein
VTEQLQMPHTTVCQAVKICLRFQLAGSSVFVNFVYVVSETECLIVVFFRDEGTFEPTTVMLIR